jgi:hypothetical protein
MGLDDEMDAVRSMKVADIKLELIERGLATTDIFEKDEFWKRLAQARVDNIRKNSSNSPPPPGERDATASAPPPPAQDSKKVREAATRAEVTAMRVSDIKAELAQAEVTAMRVTDIKAELELFSFLFAARAAKRKEKRNLEVPRRSGTMMSVNVYVIRLK